jgi:hypothetical protein
MPTLKIGDKRVTVGDEFLSLSPAEQQATVEQIASQIGITAGDSKAVRQDISNSLPRGAVGKQPLNWADVPRKALENTPQSAYQFGADIVQPFLHPVQTAQSLSDLVTGTVENFIPVNRTLNKVGLGRDEATVAKERDISSTVGQYFKDRYGSTEGLKNALASDPVGVAGDLASVLTGGEMVAAKTAGKASRIARTLDTASRAINPITVPEKAIGAAGRVVGGGAKAVLGATTGTGGDTIGEAYRAGRTGGDAQKAFLDNMRGNQPQDAVIEEARGAIENIADSRRKQYQKDMAEVGASQRPVNFGTLENKFQAIVEDAFYKGHQNVSAETMSKLKEIGEVVNEWSGDPRLHTAEGLDALKKRVDDLMPAFGDSRNKAQAVRYVTAIRNAVKDAILEVAPEYAKAMRNYESSKTLQREIERSLSLGKNNSADQTLRKLQSLTRNNVNTNYGARAQNAKVLQEAGAPNLMPSLAGQALNTLVPRGMMQPLITGGLLGGAAMLNPSFLLGLPAASPRLVGEATRAVGASARQLSRVPRPTKEQLLLLNQLGNASLLGQQ